jgi:hypothetical protein
MFHSNAMPSVHRPVRAATIALFAIGILSAHASAASAQAGGAKPSAAEQAAWKAVDQAMGRPGTLQPGDVQRYSFPRSDLHVMLGGVAIKPALALGSWVALKHLGAGSGDVMAMGDLVLLEDEVAPVMTKLQATGVTQTALHNHLQEESPRVMYMHIEARGQPTKIARAIHDALALTKTPSAAPPAAAAAFGLDTTQLAAALGRSGKVTGGVYQVSVPRAEPIRMDGVEIPPAMGVATALNFQRTGAGKAAITGDFVLTGDEINLVIQRLGEAGITVTAVHSHMLGEEPRLFFLHFWANDDAVKLAHGLRVALGAAG